MIKKGFSLALTLWIVAIMSLASALYLSYAKKVVQKTKQLNQKLQLTFDTESTIELVKFYIATGYFEKNRVVNKNMSSIFPSIPISLPIDGTKQVFDNSIIILQDTAGLVNINDIDAVANFFTQSNDIENKNVLVDSVKDWLDLDEFVLLNGAESSYYRNRKYGYGPRNGLYFASIDEIFLVRRLDRYSRKIQKNFYNNLIVSDYVTRNILTMDDSILRKVYGLTQNEIEQLMKVKREDIDLFISMFYKFNMENINWERDNTFPSNLLKIRVSSNIKNVKKETTLIVSFRSARKYLFRVLEYHN